MEDLVSVIIPVYNRTDYLPECIQSLKWQTYENLEIILIDDGSTDGTLELCKQYAQEDSRVTVIAANHGGVSAARNQGLDVAKGSFILFADSDDMLHPRLAEAMVNSLVETGAAIAGTRNLLIAPADWHRVPEFIEQFPGPAAYVHHDAQQTIDAFFHSKSPLGVIGGILIRTDLIGKTRFNTDLFIGEDYYFIYENLIKGADAVFLQERWYYYRVHENNSGKNHNFDSFWTRFYRRKLVWQSEEALGRTEYVNIQKRNAFAVFLNATTTNRMPPADQKKMRAVIKEHRKELFPAFRKIGKIRYYLAVYLPFTQRLLNKVGRFLRKRKKK